MCRRGDSCSKTLPEEFNRVRKVLTTSKYDIMHYSKSHPLYNDYSKFIKDNSEQFKNVICRGGITEEYISAIQDQEPILSVARSIGTDGSVQFNAFAQSTIYKHPDNSTELHIFTICTTPGSSLGRPMMESLQNYVTTHIPSIKDITLESVAESVEFYKKLGFEYRPRTEDDDQYVVPMKKTIGGYLPLKYFKGLSSRKKTQRKKEISKFGKMSFKNPKAYVGFSTDKNVKTRRSNYTAKFKSMFSKAKSLTQKAKATGVPVGYLRKSYDRGMAAWRTGHRPGATQQQWGYARVHSLLTCGKTYSTTDSDIVKEAKSRSKTARNYFKKCK
jgi:hypothetical protein